MNPLPPLLLKGDALTELARIPDDSIDSIVTDPPYGLANTDPGHVVEALTKWATGDREFIPEGRGFTGKAWDAFVPPPAVWDECLRVLKPGGHLLAFAGSRTFDLMALSIRFAGFDIRDSIAWLYGSGFPKSMDVSKAIDKRPGVKRHPEFAAELRAAIAAAGFTNTFDVAEQVLGRRTGAVANWQKYQWPEAKWWPALRDLLGMDGEKWDGVIAEAERVKTGQHRSGLATGSAGVGAAGAGGDRRDDPVTDAAKAWQGWGTALKPAFEPIVVARKPFPGTVAANVLAHGTGALNIDATRIGDSKEVPASPAATGKHGVYSPMAPNTGGAGMGPNVGRWPANVILDESQAEALDESRFFYVAKAPKSERPVVDGVAHPTVKPLTLMRQLVKLVTPPEGVVLEPFAGSGTTLEAAYLEGFESIGIEMTPDYWPLIQARIERITS